MRLFRTIYHVAGLCWLTLKFTLKPKRVDLTFQFADHLIGLGAYREGERLLKANTRALEMIRNRFYMQPISLGKFADYPKGTLGREFADYMIAAKLEPDFYPSLDVKCDAHYVLQRLRTMHDIVHLVTGFDTSENGEVGLQSFLVAQVRSPFAMMIVGGAVLFAPFKPPREGVASRMDMIAEGWTMGKRAELLLTYDWDRAWMKPLEEVRKELCIEPHGAAIRGTEPVRNTTMGVDGRRVGSREEAEARLQ